MATNLNRTTLQKIYNKHKGRINSVKKGTSQTKLTNSNIKQQEHMPPSNLNLTEYGISTYVKNGDGNGANVYTAPSTAPQEKINHEYVIKSFNLPPPAGGRRRRKTRKQRRTIKRRNRKQ